MRTIADLHPDDHHTRVNLRTALIALRRDWGLSQYQVADRLGVGQPVVNRFEKQLQWRLSTLSRLARAIDSDTTIRYTLIGFPDPWHVHGMPGHEQEQPDRANHLEHDPWNQSRAIADAIGARHAVHHTSHYQVTLSRLADIIGCTEPTLSEWEDKAEYDTRLPVLQRYVRATAIAARMPDAYLAVDLDRPHR